MNTTEKAGKKLRGILIQKCSDIGLGFRVEANTDPSGKTILDIKVDYEHPDDKVIKSDGVKILLDNKAANLLSEYELDYLDDPVKSFVFKTAERSIKS